MHPKAFVSHASEDKDRFVLGFAARLRARGIDAWVDRWEILPGDSFVRRLFDEGLQAAQAVVVVLSRHSVDKPWVQAEIDAAVVHRIERGCRLVPVVLDDCPIPPSLVATLWERIEDLDAYDASFERIVAAILGLRQRPPLGPVPAAAASADAATAGLAVQDAQVLQAIGDRVMATGSALVGADELVAGPSPLPLARDAIDESLDVLEAEGLLQVERFLGPEPPWLALTSPGLARYTDLVRLDTRALTTALASAVVDEGLTTADALAARVSRPRVLVEPLLRRLQDAGHLVLETHAGGRVEVAAVRASLRRDLEAGRLPGLADDRVGR